MTDSLPAASQPSRVKRFLDWLLTDRTTGTWVVGQFPNRPLWLFLAATVAGLVLPLSGWAEVTVRLVSAAALLWWSLDELLRGVNPLRRILGGVVTVWGIVALVMWAAS